MNKIYKPKFDKLFFWVWMPTVVVLVVATALTCFEPLPLLILFATDIFTLYFLVSPMFGYVELRENTMYVKYGFILKKEIPYAKIRDVRKERGIYTTSMLSLKNAMEHVTVSYNRFDVTAVSVVDNDAFITDLNWRVSRARGVADD